MLVSLALASTLRAQDDPVPIRRELLPPQRLAAELDRARIGALVRLPRDEFERRVRHAALAQKQPPPRLAEICLQGRFLDNALAGSGEWSIHGTGLLAAEPLSPAITSAHWSDNAPALMADLDGRPASPGLELLVEPGQTRWQFDWSQRAIAEPAGARLELKLPPAGVATLEFDTPAGCDVQAKGGARTGPVSQPDGTERWRIAFGGASSLELLIRPPGRATPLLLTTARHRQELTATAVPCSSEWDIEPRPGAVRELVIDHDPTLTPLDVQARDLLRWEPLAGGRVRVLFAEPFAGGPVRFRGSVPVAAGQPWTSPAVRIAGAVERGAELKIFAPPEVQLDDFAAGSWRLTHVELSPERGSEWTLRPTLARPDAGRPRGTVTVVGPDLASRERHLWTVDAERSTLQSRYTLDARRGPLFALAFTIPPGWQFERVEATPAELAPVAGVVGNALAIQLQRPILPGHDATMTLSLRRNGGYRNGPARQSFPDVTPQSARQRTGLFAIRHGPLAEVIASTGMSATENDDEAGYRFDGGIDGTLELRPRGGRLAIKGESEWRDGHWRNRVQFQPHDGAPEGVLVVADAPLPAGLRWRTVVGDNRIARAAPADFDLLAGALAGPFAAVAARAARGAAQWQWWQFATPLTGPFTTEAEGELPPLRTPFAAGQQWQTIKPAGPIDRRAPTVTEAQLRATWDGAGRLDATLQFELHHWPETGLPVRWPGFATDRRATVAGASAVASERLPLPAGDGSHRVELRWSQPTTKPLFGTRLTVELPTLPLPLSPEVAWSLPDGFRRPFNDHGLSPFVARPARLLALSLAIVAGLAALALARDRLAGRRGLRWLLPGTLLLGGATHGHAPGPAVVYLLPGDGPEVALVPPELLSQLDALSRGPRPASGAFALSADWSGRADDTGASLRLVIDACAFGDTATFDLPLSGAQLRGWTVDDKTAYPQANGERFRVTLPGAGRHRLVIDLFAPVTVQGGERELRVVGPDAASQHASVQFPAGARGVHAPAARGRQRWHDNTLDAELGRAGGLLLRWAAPAAMVKPQATAAYLWDVTESAATLFGAVRVTCASPVEWFTLALPPELDVASVVLRSPDGVSAPAMAWHTAADRLSVEPAAPVQGTWLLALELVPRAPLGPTLPLLLPRPLDVDDAGAFLAYRVAGATATPRRPADWLPMSEDAFLKEQWLPARLERTPTPPTKAYRRAPGAAGTPVVLALAPLAPRWRGAADVTWTVGPARADVRVEAALTPDAGAPPLVEWELSPVVTVRDAGGAGVLGWSRGTRLQLWMDGAASVRWTGVAPKPDATGRWEVPPVRTAGGGANVVVEPREGFSLVPLGAIPGLEASGRGWQFRWEGGGLRPAFSVKPLPKVAPNRVP